MKEEKVWEVLGVEPGADEEIIKTAYREKLVGTNPEDDPEGFKLLREAYEMAINLRNRKSEEPVVDEKEKTPAEKLVEQAAELYFDIFRRNDPKCWEDFFSDPLIEGLDTIDEVRRAFLVFTMNHFVYSPEMWKEFDRVFRLVDEEKTLAEEFPPDFINYIKERIIDGEYFTYDDITDSGNEMAVFVRSLPISAEGSYEEEGLDCKEDIYIRNVTSLLPLYSTVDNKYSSDEDKERLKVEIAERINAARRYSIFHPFEGLGLMMYYYITGDRENALKVAEYSTASDRIDSCDKFSVSYSAHVVMDHALKENDQDTDHLDMIAERLKKIVSDNPKFQMAHFALAEYYYFKGDHVKASDHILNASEYNEASAEIDAFIDKNDIGLVRYYRDRIDSGIATENDHIELGWCLLRNEDYANSDITKLLDEISPTPETEYNYYNLYARCCVKDEDYKKAFPYVKRWHEMVLETYERSLREGTENFSPEEKKRLARVSYSYYLMAICNAEAGNFDEAEKDYRKASEFAENKNDKIIFLKVLGEYYHKEKKYNYAFDLWNEILDMEPRFTPGYMMRQEAAFMTRRAQQVINDYYDITGFAPDYAMAYVYAAKVFHIYDQSEDFDKVFETAKENNAVSDMLLFEKAKYLKDKKEYEEAEEIFESLRKKIFNDKNDLMDIGRQESKTDRLDKWMDTPMDDRTDSWINTPIGGGLNGFGDLFGDDPGSGLGDNDSQSVVETISDDQNFGAEDNEAGNTEDDKENSRADEEGAIEDKARFYSEYGVCLFENAKRLKGLNGSSVDSFKEGRKDYESLSNRYLARAWKCVEKGLKEQEDSIYLHWLITDLLEYQGKDVNQEYQTMLEMFPDDCNVNYEYGRYLERMDKIEEAVEQYKETVRKNPAHQDAYGNLTDYYIDKYTETEDEENYKKAIEYIEIQIKNCDDTYFRVKQALAYIEGYEFEKALEAAETAVKQAPDNIFAYNAKGYALMMLGRLKEAEEVFKTGLFYMETPRKTALQENLVLCLERQGKFDEAYKVYSKFCKDCGLSYIKNKERKAKLLERMGDYTWAENIYSKLFEDYAKEVSIGRKPYLLGSSTFMIGKLIRSNTGNQDNIADMADLQLTMMDMYVLSGNKDRFMKLSQDIRDYVKMEFDERDIANYLFLDEVDKKLRDKYMDRVSALNMIGRHMLYVSRDYLLAEKCFNMVIKLVEHLFTDIEGKYSNLYWVTEIYLCYAESCYRNRHLEAARKAAGKALEIIREGWENEAKYTSFHNYRPRRLEQMAEVYFFMGEKEKAFEYLDEMNKCGLCCDCHERKCYESYLALAKFYELSDNNILALEYYQKAHEITDDDAEVEKAISALK